MQIFRQKSEKFFQQPKFCPPRPRNCMAIRGYKQSAFCNAFFCPKSCKCQKLFILLHSLSPSALGATDDALRHKSATRPRLLPTTNTALVCVGDPGYSKAVINQQQFSSILLIQVTKKAAVRLVAQPESYRLTVYYKQAYIARHSIILLPDSRSRTTALQKTRALPSQKNAHCIRYQKTMRIACDIRV